MSVAAENMFCNNCPEHKTCSYVKMGRTDLCSKLDYFAIGYEQAIEDVIAYLKANSEKYIVDCTPTYPDAPQELKIGGMLYEHLRQSLTDD